jgi:uncharacterized protein
MNPIDVFMESIFNDNEDKVYELIAQGIDVNQLDEDGCSALMSAVSSGNQRIVRNLVESGADPNVVIEDGNDTALSIAILNLEDDIFDYLVPFVSKQILELSKKEALYSTAIDGNPDVIEFLSKKDTDFEISFSDSHDEDATPLIVSAFSRNISVVRALLDFGANVDSRNGQNQTALMFSVKPRNALESKNSARVENQVEIIRMLLKAGADPNAQDNESQTALEIAYQSNAANEVISVLQSVASA